MPSLLAVFAMLAEIARAQAIILMCEALRKV